MAAGVYNLSIEQGATWELSLGVEVSEGTDMDLTGSTVESKLAKSHYDDDPLGISATIINHVDGKLRLSLTAAQTSQLDPSHEYIYDVELTDSNGVVTRLIQGRISISPSITS